MSASAALNARRLRVAVVGSGISGLSCAWLLAQRHDVTVYERDRRLGGHSNTVEVTENGAPDVSVDTGFIVFNERTYPNLTALLAHLGVATEPSDMSFAASLRGGAVEYSGTGLGGVFAQKSNALRPRFWAMLSDLMRFYRQAPRDLSGLDPRLSLGAYLDARGYGAPFRDDHLLPMAAAIWSSPAADMLAYPAASFIRFCANHNLLQVGGRPVWRTVTGGSRSYVARLAAEIGEGLRPGAPVAQIDRRADGRVIVGTSDGLLATYDHVVLATHADEALSLIARPTAEERRLLSAFAYSRNRAVLHTDERLMPARRRVWSSWNYVEADGRLCVTYWMNRLQNLPGRDLFVTLNPAIEPREGSIIHAEDYDHPVFDAEAVAAQRSLWDLQGVGNVWFCGAHFGAGFHEDGLQAGLAVAEELGGARRPWSVAEESGRIHLARKGAPLAEAA